MKKTLLAAVGISTTLLFTGCSSETSSTSKSEAVETSKPVTKDGAKASVEEFFTHVENEDVKALKKDLKYNTWGMSEDEDRLNDIIATLNSRGIPNNSQVFRIYNRDMKEEERKGWEEEQEATKNETTMAISVYRGQSTEDLNMMFALEKIHGKFRIKAMMMADENESIANYLTSEAMEKYNIQ